MTAGVSGTVDAIAAAQTWSERVQRIRRVPEEHGVAVHRQVYAELARRMYVPKLTPDLPMCIGGRNMNSTRLLRRTTLPQG